jgi:peptidyl-dipeptidase Dcp
MSEYRTQERFNGEVRPIVSNNCNFVPGKPGEPTLISWIDAVTLFHEFGHALHGLSSNVTYPTLAGTSVARDFVELPSQLNEHWLSAAEVLGRFAVHYRTGEPMPQALQDKLKRARAFNEGFATVEFLASAIADMRLHLQGEAPVDMRRFERDCLAEIGMPKEIVMRHRIPHFGHIFSGDHYSAGYYSYLWSEVLDHDAFEAFQEEGGPFNPATAARYRDTILSVGDTMDPAEAWLAFRGRAPDPRAYFRFKGFPVSGAN